MLVLLDRKYAPRCSVCGEPIMPEQGQEETVRIVALDRSFHVNCYVCEVRTGLYNTKYQKQGPVNLRLFVRFERKHKSFEYSHIHFWSDYCMKVKKTNFKKNICRNLNPVWKM